MTGQHWYVRPERRQFRRAVPARRSPSTTSSALPRAAAAMAAVLVVTAGVVATGAAPAVAAVIPPPEAATLVSANPSDLTPNARDGEVRAYAEIGTTIYVGGTFTQLAPAGSTAWTTQPYLFAYDRVSGALSTTFLPHLDGAVNALLVGPTGALIVGGSFNTVDGAARRGLVALDPATGATVAGWAGRADGGMVRSMALGGNRLYVGGAFHWIDGTAHSLLARLDASTGAIDPTFQVDASGGRSGTAEYAWTLALSPDGRTLVAGGNFSQVNGQTRNQIAMIDLTGTPTVTAWNTHHYESVCYNNYPSYVQGIDFSDDGSYFVVGANGGSAADAYCDSTVRFETGIRADNLDATWVDYTGTDSVISVEASDGVIYIAGHFRWLNNANASDSAGPGAIDRLGIGALDPSNGMPLRWNPRRSAGANLPSWATAWGALVPVLWRGSTGLYFGHDSDGMGGEYHGRMGMFPLDGGRTVTPPQPLALPGAFYLGTGDGQLTRVPFDGHAFGGTQVLAEPSFTGAKAAFTVGNKLYWARTDPAAPTGSQLEFSVFDNHGVIGDPWVSGYNTWFYATNMNGAFELDGRMYYVRDADPALHYRYLEPDGTTVGCTEFTVPTTGIDWSLVRGMAYVGGRIVYGSTDGALRWVAFDPTRPPGAPAADGGTASVLAPAGSGLAWSSPTLFYATH